MIPSDPIRAPGWDSKFARFVPYVFAITTGYRILVYLVVSHEQIGFDARLYTAATRAWLKGQDPWSVSILGVHFGAPPPTLLAFVPFVMLPDLAITVIWVFGSFVLAALALRALHMPAWWLIFWPIVDGAMVGNPDVAILSLLVIARGRLAALAPILKIYAFAPLIGERRFRTITLSVVILAVTAPILPWGLWFGELPTISERLILVSATTSIFGDLPLMVAGSVALLLLGLRRAGWLAVPVLWPSTQPHYLAMSVPAMSPLLAVAWSFPDPLIVVSAIAVEAIVRRPSDLSGCSLWRGINVRRGRPPADNAMIDGPAQRDPTGYPT
jgi:hypothetical protein